jgi:Tol biopolymer transport system component
MLAAMMTPLLVLAQGKNKIQYEDFEWKSYDTAHFRIFHDAKAANILPDVANMAEAAYQQVSDKLQHQLNFKVPFIAYKTHEEFAQTNIFPGFLPRAVGAFAEPFQSRMVLPLDGSPEENYALIVHELTHIFQFDMLYNNRISTIIRSTAPTWFTEGMASYVADDENNLDRMVLRDAAVNSNFSSLGAFAGFSFIAYRIGNAAFQYIEDTYGIEGVRDFLWQYRKNITGSVGSAIERAFEVTVEDFDRDFRKYLRRQYVTLLPIKEEPDDHAREVRTRRVITTLSPELSPSGDLFAAIVPFKNELDLVLISTKDGRIFKNLTRGYTNRYRELNVNAFQGVNDLGWSDDGNELVFTAFKEGTSQIYVINVLNGDIVEEVSFGQIRDAQSPVFSKDGNTIYFVGNKQAAFDVYSYDRATGDITNLTKDEYHDRNPRLSPNGQEIIYSSSRLGFYKIFAMDLKSGKKTQLTSGLGNDIQATYSPNMESIYFSSDRFDDIYNIYQLDLNTGDMYQYTNILTGAFSPQERIFYDAREGEETKQLVFTAYYQGRYRVYRMDKPESRRQLYTPSEDSFDNVKDYNMSAGLQFDPERVVEYQKFKNFAISNVNVNAGATDDGRFITSSSIQFSDVLGDHVLDVNAYSVSSLENYSASYVDRSNRLQWGVAADSLQQFFVARTNPIDFETRRFDRTYKSFNVAGFVRYPLSLYTRLDASLGFTDQDIFRPVRQTATLDNGDEFVFYLLDDADFAEPFATLGFSVDTVRYQRYGPQHGMLFDVGYKKILDQSDTFSLDFRGYQELTRRSLLAFRLLADYSDGDVPELFALGGNNYLRGNFLFNEFIGAKRLLSQLEIRMPLVDEVRFPGFSLTNIRGAFYVDAGGTWYEDDDFNFEFPADPDPLNPDPFNDWDPINPPRNYLIGSYGLDIAVNLFGLETHWTWARRTNFSDFPSNSKFSFWIGRKF